MGPSGCGKSTFLSVLSGMSLFGASQRIVTGRILVNGKKRGSWIKKIAVFVPQEDHIMAMLTVRECLTYSAILRLPVTTSMDTVSDAEVKAEMLLHECKGPKFLVHPPVCPVCKYNPALHNRNFKQNAMKFLCCSKYRKIFF